MHEYVQRRDVLGLVQSRGDGSSGLNRQREGSSDFFLGLLLLRYTPLLPPPATPATPVPPADDADAVACDNVDISWIAFIPSIAVTAVAAASIAPSLILMLSVSASSLLLPSPPIDLPCPDELEPFDRRGD